MIGIALCMMISLMYFLRSRDNVVHCLFVPAIVFNTFQLSVPGSCVKNIEGTFDSGIQDSVYLRPAAALFSKMRPHELRNTGA